MKKFSVWLMTIALFCVCMLFSACNPTNNASITFDKTNVTIYLGESENNQVSLTAKVENVNVNKLEMVYDTSFISISQNKNADGTFTITIKSLIDYGTKPIAVEVKAGDKASAVFYVDIVLPLQNIVAKENAYISYNGIQTIYNLNKYISFEPEGTIQTGVEYSLTEENDYVHIENNSLILDAGLNVSELKQIKINAVSTIDASISAELNLKLIPTADLLADNISVMVDYDGEKTQIQNKTYELTIKKEETGYTLSTFVVEITIPQSLGIKVDLDSSSAGGLSTNILNYLSYSSSHLIDATTSSNVKDVYTFTFSAKSSLQGAGDLRFKYWYKDYEDDKSLTSLFVAKIAGEIVKSIPVVATMPVTHIDVQTDCSLNAETNTYTIFSNYNTYGEAFTFVAMPYGTSQNVIVLEKTEDSNLRIYNSKGNLLTFGRNVYDENGEIVETKSNQLEINSGDAIYIVGGEKATETLTYFSSADGKADLTRKTLSFNVIKGTSALGFVESTDSLILKTEVSLYAEVGNSTSTYIYAPDTKSDDFIKDSSISIDTAEKANYYKVTFTASNLGKHTYTIKTINGFSITANLTVIQPLESAIVTMKNNSGFVAGVGDYAPKNDNNSDLVNISIQNGYSVELAYNVNKNAQIAKIKYSFYNPLNIDVYGDEIALLKDVYNYAVPTALDELSLILNNQNLAQSNILTGVKAGVNIVKIEIYGQKVVNGNLVEEVAFTKYLFVQVYNPVKQITSTAKNITLRALDQVASSYESLTTKTLSLNVLSNADEVATYNKIYIEGGKVQTILGDNGEPELVCTRTITNDGIDAIKLVYSYETGKLTISANKFTVFETQPIIKLFAVDFRNITGSAYSDSDIICTYIINVNLLETKAISDISVSNLTLDEDKSDATTKVYNTIYIDTSKSESITYKLYTDITPSDAFDKALKYTFTPNSGSTQAMLDISSNGVITILGSQGGTGVITIEPLNARDGITVKTIKIPIVVSDGNSWETAYEITSLDEIKFSNKHYVLTIPTTYTLNKTLFESLESGFSGGLYGRRFGDTTSAKATIKLDGVSLFNVLANNAYIADLDICGDVTQTSYTKDDENVIFTSRGFVANINNGTINNVKVTSYIKNGVYVPSLLTVGANVTAVGGIAGTNAGVVKNCTFAGSINIASNSSLQAKAITNNGTVENCKVIIAKYQSEINSTRLVSDGENYVNGVVGGAHFADIDDHLVKEENYKDYSFAGNVWIANYSNGELNHSYGEEDNNYGLIFYYQAKDSSKQSLLNKYNVIALSNLLGLKNTALTCDNLKVMAMLSDNSQCNFISVDSQSLTINGIGEFVLSISSEYDYTQVSKLNVLAINHANEFTLSGNGIILNNSSELELVYGQKYEILSKLNNIVKVVKDDGRYESIELNQNNFDLSFTISYDGALTEINASDYITGTKLGSHTVNMSFDWFNSTKVQVKLVSGFDAKHDLLINKFFELSESVNSEFSLKKRNGTTEITTNISDGSIEPKDTFTFTATLTTDLSTDKIDKGYIEIYSQENINLTEFGYFDIFVEKDATIENTYKIQISINQDKIRDAGYNLLDFVSKTYTIKVKAINTVGTEDKIYDALASVSLRLLPQTVADINTTLYNVSTSNTSGINVSDSEAPTSVLIPSGNGGLFVINMYPAYASYDYIDVVATANTVSKLSFRLQERIIDGEEVTNNYKNASTGYEPLYGQNGIRLLNNNTKDNQNIGTYYLKVFADTSFSGDTIFTITVKAYYKDEEVTAKSVFTLFMRMPEAPQISLNGETKVYTLAGKTIEDIEVLIADDQINPMATIASDSNGDSVIDGKSTSKILCRMDAVSENSLVGYRRYKITVSFDDDYVNNLSTNSTQFKIVVTSTKISNGLEIPVSSEMYIYVVDYKTNSDDIRIFNASEDRFKVTSLKYVELKLADLLADEVSATQEFIDLFNENYYFANENTGFTFGTNKYLNGETEIELTRPQILASYLSYVKGNSKSPLLKVDNDNNLQLISNEYVTFDFKDGKLMVKGGNYTGSVSMILEIEYKMPDGKIVTYEYRFEIVNSLYTTEDLPKEVATVESFLDIENNEDAQDYILTSDLYLYDYKTISDTSKITSLDGNNHTIHIINFLEDESSTSFALFNNVTSNTTIKNLTVNLYHLKQIVVGDSIKNIQIAGFALQNDGAIYNCEVVAYNNNVLPTMANTFGIKVDTSVETEVAGFVLTNNGSITNSRFGGTSKLTTKIEYTTDKNNIVVDRKVIEKTYNIEMLSIIASGTLSGFVGTNNGVIASSFVKNVNIKNTYNKLETKVTSGFVGTNNGTISMSYAEGGFEKETDIRATLGGLEGTGIMAGFVYLNTSNITDCYSNISISNNKEQVGRLGAGFVYENADSGIIERCYSASKITSNNISQMNFAGIKDFGGYNNAGQIKTSYYYIENTVDEISIESVLGTSITAVVDVSNKQNFYGFNFASSNYVGTWQISEKGVRPELVSTNDIAHSVRAKYETANNATGNANVEYVFEYCDDYILGSKNNPIIIRDAKEFNAVFGDSSSTDISNVYDLTNAKVYGTYRLVNNVDMLDLVPKEEQDTEYKVNLVSTKMTLTGKYTNSSNMAGAINGNGLTIKNLAISNSSSTSEGFGLFKSLEDGAGIANLNIELADGGVSADHTVYVGTIAGTLEDSYANNITIKGTSANEYTKVVGANITGGMFGRVVGDSSVSNCTVENISVTSTYNKSVSITNSNVETVNVYEREKENTFSSLSISGGAFGVVDIYTTVLRDNKTTYSNIADTLNSSLASIAVKGGVLVEGMTAGGVAGFIGNYVIARDLSLTIYKDAVQSGIIAYSCYAGAIAGFSRGYLYQIKAEHEQDWQDEIESNIQSYYTAQDDDARVQIDRGVTNLFETELNYSPFAVGGLIGVQQSGKLSIAYSKLNVENKNAKNIGGVIGFIATPMASTTTSTTSSSVEDMSFIMHETYAVGNVYSKKASAKIGGVIGYSNDSSLKLTKVNAMNYWSKEAYEIFNPTSLDVIGLNIEINAIGNNIDGDSTYVYSIGQIKFGASEYKIIFREQEVMKNYYNYDGVLSDNGAQIDLMFEQKAWYIDNNWTRDITEMYPHIVYISPKNMYTISHKDDFNKFILYGADPNVTFVVVDNRDAKNDDDLLIDCSSVNGTYGLIRAKIVGATNKNGFKNLKVPLFSTLSNNEVSSLILENCSAPLAQTSISETFRYLTYVDCTFTASTKGNIGGVTQTVSGKNSEFNNISFKDCKLNTNNVNNAGLLFGLSTDESLYINNIAINVSGETSTSIVNITRNITKADESSYGILFGRSNGKVVINGLELYDDLSVQIGDGEDIATTANIGLIGGYASNIVLNMNTITLKQKNGLKVNVGELEKSTLTLQAGGIVGYGETVILQIENTSEYGESATLKNVTFAPNINIDGSANNLYLGTICGNAKSIQAFDAIYIIGKTEETTTLGNRKTVFKEINYSFAKENTNVGGVTGSVQSICANITEDTKPNGIIAYYGDLVAQSSTADNNYYLNMGGIVGSISSDSDSTSTISNVLFDGTIGFNNDYYKEESLNNLYMRIGGIVGYISGSNTTIKNVVASGEIVLSNSEGKTVKLADGKQYAGGLIGLNAGGNTTLGTADETDSGNVVIKQGENVIVITTIFSLNGANNIDSIANTSKKITLANKVKYCSALNLVVSNLNDDNLSYTKNNASDTLYDWLVNDEYSNMGSTETANSVWINVQNNTVKGSKLDPIMVNGDLSSVEGLIVLNVSEIDKEINKNTYFYTKTTNYKDGEITTFYSTYKRKLYISVSGESKLQNQISLKNTILFSKGATLQSTFTPINKISDDSAVTGIVAQIYINETFSDNNTNTDKYYNFGGFANVNNGIIYTCSVQEWLNNRYSNSTCFYGIIETNTTKSIFNENYLSVAHDDINSLTELVDDGSYRLPRGIGGFVSYNSGYIFGSNSNVDIRTNERNNIVTSNFVVSNTGTISYCYSTGIGENKSTKNNQENTSTKNFGNGYLFVADPNYNQDRLSGSNNSGVVTTLTCGEINNCYTITKALAECTNTYLPSGVYTESDAVEKSGLSNTTTLYKTTKANSNLLKKDSLGYYACDQYSNYNYPTISGGAFKNFTFTKRSTMVAYNSEAEKYEEKDATRPETDDDYYKCELYFQIPNLTVLKDLETNTSGNGLTSTYSKFVIISDINVGYSGSKITNNLINTLQPKRTKTVDDKTYVIPVIIDGQNNYLKNLTFGVISNGTAQFIKEVKQYDDSAVNGGVTRLDGSYDITIKNIIFGGVTLNGASGLIGTTSTNTLIDNVSFADDSTITIGTGSNNGEKTIGALVGVNSGRIQNCVVNSLIKTTDKANTGSWFIGGLVGENKGTIASCKFLGSAYIIEVRTEDDNDLTVVFGGLVALNNGTVTQCELKTSANSLTYGYHIDGRVISATEEEEQYITSLADKKLSTIVTAQIYVKTSNKAIVGGIVGKHQGGIITRSMTAKNTNDKDLMILVGDEYDQKIAYAGGIAGYVANDSTVIQDCSNRGNITAMATWLFTTSNNDNRTIAAADDGIMERKKAQDNGADIVYYDDANTNYTFYTENKSEYARVFVYKEMTSLAYAGGIAGAGLTTAETDEGASEGNVRLANFGNISGGFRAYKPAAIIHAGTFDSSEAESKIKQFNYSFVAAETLNIVFKNIKGITNVGKVVKSIAAIAAVVAIITYVDALDDLKTCVQDVSVVIEGIQGCSAGYYNNIGYNYQKLLFNDKTLSDSNMVTEFNAALGMFAYNSDKLTEAWELFKKGGSSLVVFKNMVDTAFESTKLGYETTGNFIYSSNFLKRVYAKFSTHNLTALIQLAPLSWVVPELKRIDPMYKMENISVSTQLYKIIDYSDIQDLVEVSIFSERDAEGNPYYNDNTKVTSKTITKDSAVKLTSYSYDGICPDLTGSSEKLQVYSSTTNSKLKTQTDSSGNEVSLVTLNTGSPANATIEFNSTKIDTEMFNKYSSTTGIVNTDGSLNVGKWHTEAHPWLLANNGTTMIPASEDSLKVEEGAISGNSDTGYYYTLKKASDWEKIVYTINNDKVFDYKNNMHIIVNVLGNDKVILVSDSILDEFNGSITFSSLSYYFTNLNMSDSENIGLIKKTTKGVTLNNVQVKGAIKFSTNSSDGDINAGILIGSASGDIDINNVRVMPGTITFTEDSLTNMTNFGGLIGSLTLKPKSDNSIVSITNVSIGSYGNKTFDIDVLQLGEIAEGTNKSFGGFVGNVIGSTNSEELVINNASIYGTIKLVSGFNKVGGYVGSIQSGAKVNFKVIDEDETKTSNMQLNIGVASNSNTYVGGIVGENQGKLIVESSVLVGCEQGVTISADVVNGNKSAYAGGIIGYNNGGEIEDSNISLGINKQTGYNSINYILAGFNGSDLFTYEIPNKANASFGCGVGNDSYEPNHNSSIAKYLYITKAYGDEIPETATSSEWTNVLQYIKVEDSNTISFNRSSGTQVFKTESKDGYNYLTSSYKTYEQQLNERAADGKTITSSSTYKYKEKFIDEETGEEKYTEGEEITLTDKVIMSSDKKIAYKFVECDSKNLVKTSHPDDVVLNQYMMYVKYVSNTERYTKKIEETDIEYKFLISVIGLNAKVEDTGRYMLIVTQLNDFDITTEDMGIVEIKTEIKIDGKVQSVDDVDDTVETELTKTIYKEKSVNKLLFSKMFNLKDLSSTETTLFELSDVFNFDLYYSESESSSSVSDENSDITTIISKTLSAKFKNKTITFAVNKQSDEFNLKIYSPSVATAGYNVRMTEFDNNIVDNLDSTSEEDSGDTNMDSSKTKNVCEKEYTIEIFSTKLQKDSICFGHEIAIDKYNKYSVKVGSTDFTELGSDNYYNDITINSVSLKYAKPSYTYFIPSSNTKEYVDLFASKYTDSRTNTDYIIVTGKNILTMVNAGNVIQIEEHIYKISGTNLIYCGYISYNINLSITTESGLSYINSAEMNYQSIFGTGNNLNRYESFFPDLNEEQSDCVSNFETYIEKDSKVEADIKFNYNYTYNELKIYANENEMYYKYIITAQPKKVLVKFNITSNKFEEVGDHSTNGKETTSTASKPVSKITLNGLLVTKELNANDSSVEVKTGAPSEDNLSVTFEDSTETIEEYYVYDGTIVGVKTKYVFTEQELIKDESGNAILDDFGNEQYQDVEKTGYRYYNVNGNKIDGSVLSNKSDIKFYVLTGGCDASKLDVKKSV